MQKREDTSLLILLMKISGITFIARGFLNLVPANYWNPPTVVNSLGIILSVLHWAFLGLSLIIIVRKERQNEGVIYKLWSWIIIASGTGFLIIALGSVLEGLELIQDITDQLNSIAYISVSGMFVSSLLGIASRNKIKKWSWLFSLPVLAILITPTITRLLIGTGLIFSVIFLRKNDPPEYDCDR